MTARDELHRVAIELAEAEVELGKLARDPESVTATTRENRDYWRLNREYWHLINDVANGAE